jgi:hypothetical protein
MARRRLYGGDSVVSRNQRKELRAMADLVQPALLIAGWTAAFLLGKELQGAFTQWRASKRSE